MVLFLLSTVVLSAIENAKTISKEKNVNSIVLNRLLSDNETETEKEDDKHKDKDLTGQLTKANGDNHQEDQAQKEDDSNIESTDQQIALGPSKVETLLNLALCEAVDPIQPGGADYGCPAERTAIAAHQYIESYLTVLKGSPSDKSEAKFASLVTRWKSGHFTIYFDEELPEQTEEEKKEEEDSKCDRTIKAYSEEFEKFKAVFVFVHKNRKSGAIGVSVAVLFVPKDTKSYLFVEEDMRSTKDIEKLMAGEQDEDMDKTPINIEELDRVVGVEISSRMYFDGYPERDKNMACQLVSGVFARFFDLLKHLKVTNFDLEVPEKFDDALGYKTKEENEQALAAYKEKLYSQFVDIAQRKDRELVADRSLAQKISLLLTEVSKEMNHSRARRLGTVEDAKLLFMPAIFFHILEDKRNPLQWKNLRKTFFFLHSLYSADFDFLFVVKSHTCPGEDEFRSKEVLVLTINGRDAVSFSFIVTTPTEEDDNIHVCLETFGEIGSSILSSLNCYDLDPNAYNDEEEKEESLKKQKADFYKILEMMVGNLSDVVEDVCMLLRTKLNPVSFRKMFYLMDVEKRSREEPEQKVDRVKLTPEEHQILQKVGRLTLPDSWKAEAIKMKKDHKKKSLVIESDPSGVGHSLKMTLSLPTAELSLHKKLKFLKINVELFESKFDSYLLKLNAFDRNLEILVSTFWFEEVSLRYAGEHSLSLAKFAGRCFRSHEETRVMDEMLFAFLRNKVEVIILDWIFEVVEKRPELDSDFDKPLLSLVPQSFWKDLSEYEISSFSEVGTLLFSLMATCEFYDKNANDFLTKEENKPPTNDEDFGEDSLTTLKDFKVKWEKVSRSVESSMNDDDETSQGSGSAYLTDEEVKVFPAKQDEILGNLLDTLAFLDSRQELGSVDFKFKGSTKEMGHPNDKNFSTEIAIKLTFLEEYFWNSVHLYVSSAFFTGEYYFAAMGYSSNLYNLAKIVSEIMEQQKTRIEKALNPTKVVVLTKDGLESTIDKFLTEKNVKNSKIAVDDKKTIYLVNNQGDEKDFETDAQKVYQQQTSYFELEEIEKSTKNCPKAPCESGKKKKGFRLNFVFHPKLKKKDEPLSHINGLYSSSYEFFARYNFQYNDVVNMYLKRGLFHLGVLGTEVEEGVEHHFVNQKIESKPKKQSLRELMGQIVPVKGLLKSLGQSDYAQIRIEKPNDSRKLNLISKMVDLDL